MSKTTLQTVGKRRNYVPHPLRISNIANDLVRSCEININKVSTICLEKFSHHNDIHILSPIHAFGFLSPFGGQTQAFEQCKALLELADELWGFGDWHTSEGCKIEIQYAEILKIPTHYFPQIL